MKIRKIVFLLMFVPLLLTAEVRANYNCCTPEYCSNWVVYGEWLYWRARRCQLDFAVNGRPGADPNSSTGQVHSVDPAYDYGFRVGIQKYCDDLFFEAFYTYFRNEESLKIINTEGLSGTHHLDPVGVVTPGVFELAIGKWDLDYDTFDLLIGYEFCPNKCFQPYLFGGFKYASIDQELKSLYSENVEITGPVDKIKQKIDMNAYGIDLGIGVRCRFFKCLNLFGRASYDALLGDFRRNFTYDVSFNGGNIFLQNVNLHDECWYTVSVFNLLFGLSYDHLFNNCWCANLGISAGYEIHQWINQPDFLELQAVQNEVTFERHLQSLGFDGLFIRLFLGF